MKICICRVINLLVNLIIEIAEFSIVFRKMSLVLKYILYTECSQRSGLNLQYVNEWMRKDIDYINFWPKMLY